MKHILLAVIGISPQIITETIYKLYKDGIIISEVYVITTLQGRKEILEKLLDNRFGKLKQLEELLNISIKFDDSHIFIPEVDGKPLADIKDNVENSVMAKTIFEITEKLAEDKNCVIHASIAGGRKTMGAYLYLAMQLFGREQDRCYHILTDELAEKSKEFFFPEKKKIKSFINGNEVIVNAEDRALYLAEVPLIPFKNNLSKKHYEQFLSKVDAILEQKVVKYLTCNLEKNIIIWDKTTIKLTPAQCALYYLFLEKRKKSQCEEDCKGCPECSHHILFLSSETEYDYFLEKLKQAYGGEKGKFFTFLEKKERKEYFVDQYLRQYISRINSTIYKITANDLIQINNLSKIIQEESSRFLITYPKNKILF